MSQEIPGGSTTQSDGRTLAQKEPVHVAPVKKNVQLVKTGRS